jgi:response regulator RpfG family c-di-GMP phosphodiesterase
MQSSNATRPRILIVDDDPNLLQALKRLHSRRFDITTATDPRVAIELVRQGPDFVVVICDYQMPGMKGPACLAQIQKIAPDTVRVLLTGNNDLQTAVDAVNQGAIFRFLQKPCDEMTFVNCVRESLRQYELVLGERDVLERTVVGSVQLLSEILSLSNPQAFGRSVRVQHYVSAFLRDQKQSDAWQITTAALLFEIGVVAVPQDILDSLATGCELTTEQRAIYGRHASIGAELLSNIPRLGDIATIVRYQAKNYDGSGMPSDDLAGDKIPYGGRVLRAVIAFEARITRGQTVHEAVSEMAGEVGCYDPNILQRLAQMEPLHLQMQARMMSIRQLVAGYVLNQDIVQKGGPLIVSKGQQITESMLARLRGYAELGHIDLEVSVLVNAEPMTALR